MGCIQSKPSKRQGLFHQQEEIISRQGNNNKDDSEKVRSDIHNSGRCQQLICSLVVKLLLTKFVVAVTKLNPTKHLCLVSRCLKISVPLLCMQLSRMKDKLMIKYTSEN